MKNICDWNNCFEIGEYKAPIEKDNSKSYRLLCLNHVKEFKLINNHLIKFKLMMSPKKYFFINDLKTIISFMKKDKKNNDQKINLVLLKNIGKTKFDLNFSSKQLESFIKKELFN